jgi:hypothetical protein
MIKWTLETKSLLPSLCKREEFPLFGRRPIGPLARRAKRGQGRFSRKYVFSIMDSLIIRG